MTRTAPQVGTPTAPRLPPMSPPVATLVVGTIGAIGMLLVQFADVVAHVIAQIVQYTRIDDRLGVEGDAWIAIAVGCGQDALCSPWMSRAFREGMAWWWLILLLPPIFAVLVWRLMPKKRPVQEKDPGLAMWERKDRLTRFLPGQDSRADPFVGFMGYLKSGVGANTFDTKELPPLFVPREDWCQNTLVWGGIRSGKTTSFFQPSLFLGAHLGVTCVVFDVKWPQKDSGFFESIGYWHARGRRVVLFSPYEPTGARVNLLAGVRSASDALEVADAVFPPPEFTEERGKHYNDKKRFMIAMLVYLLVVEYGDQVSFADVISYVLKPDDTLMEFIENANDAQARQLLLGYREAGDANWAETKNGIISALKVFFNAEVVRATSGLPHETVTLEDCFRQPTLVMVGVNQKNMMDGSGEILFRLYKRLFDQAALRVADEQGGKLRVHLSYYMDELPAMGKFNYMMRSMGTLRSFNIAHHLGIQNNAQGQLVYGETYWKAISTNVVARLVVFPRGINGDDARMVSDMIGKTTALEVSVSGSEKNASLVDGGRSATARLVERDLLSYEEFSEFTLGEAVIRMNGQHPIRVQLAPMSMKTVEGFGIVPGSRTNVLNALYLETVARCPGGLIAYTMGLIRDGKLIGAPPRPVPALPVSAQVETTVTPNEAGSEVTGSVSPPAPPVAAPVLHVPVSALFDWLAHVVEAFGQVSLVEGQFSVRVSSLPEVLQHDTLVRPLTMTGYLERNQSKAELRVTKDAMRQLPEELHRELVDLPDHAPVTRWMQDNGVFIDGHPLRGELKATGVELPEVRASLELVKPQPVSEESRTPGVNPEAGVGSEVEQPQPFLICPRGVLKEMFGSTALTLKDRRVGTRVLVLIPVRSPAVTAQAIREAREAALTPSTEPRTSRRNRKQAATHLVDAAVQEHAAVTPRDGTMEG
jgi:type IV secretion system protein VirD4